MKQLWNRDSMHQYCLMLAIDFRLPAWGGAGRALRDLGGAGVGGLDVDVDRVPVGVARNAAAVEAERRAELTHLRGRGRRE